MTFWSALGLVLQVLGLGVAGWALWREVTTPVIHAKIPERPSVANPWLTSVVGGHRPHVSSHERAAWWKKMEGKGLVHLGGIPTPGAGGLNPDQRAFEAQMRDQDLQRRGVLAQIWEQQEESFADLYDATADIVEAMLDGHRRAVRRIRVEAIGLGFALLGTVISSIAG